MPPLILHYSSRLFNSKDLKSRKEREKAKQGRGEPRKRLSRFGKYGIL
jgi:hypothetical protein